MQCTVDPCSTIPLAVAHYTYKKNTSLFFSLAERRKPNDCARRCIFTAGLTLHTVHEMWQQLRVCQLQLSII